MNKIKDFTPGVHAVLILRFTNIQIKKTTANADYASLLGYDGNDLIEVKIWSLSEDKKNDLKNGEIYVASGMMKDYQGKMQFNVSDFHIANPDIDDFDPEDFYEYAKLSVDDLQRLILDYIDRISNDIIKKVVVTLLKKYYKEYFTYPAAMSMHHNYCSGLAYHIYSMLKLSDAYLNLYPFLNRDVVYAGIILHDLGKIVELSGAKGTEYTKEGNLLGHISIGAMMIHDTVESLGYGGTDEALSLEHIILSHHGLNEYGSPKEPQTPEAALIFLLDYSDSRMAALEKELDGVEKGTFTGPIAAYDRRSFYIPNIK